MAPPPRRLHPRVERLQQAPVHRRREQRDRHPYERGPDHHGQQVERRAWRHTAPGEQRRPQQQHRQAGRHRRDLAPGIDPPPEPPGQQDRPDPRREVEHKREGRADVPVHEGDRHRPGRQHEGHQLGDAQVVPLRGIPPDKPFVEVVHQVRGAPVQLRAQRRDERGEERGQQHAAQSGREQHHDQPRVRAFMVYRPSAVDQRSIRNQEHRGQRRQHPGPGAQRVVRDVEPEDRTHGLPFVLTGDQPLHDDPATVGVFPRPPLDADESQEPAERRGEPALVPDRRDDLQQPGVGQPRREGVEPADRLHGEDGQQCGPGHRPHELERVGHDDAPQPGPGRVHGADEHRADDGPRARQPGCFLQHLRHAHDRPHADDIAVVEQPPVERLDAAQPGGRPAAVAQLDQRHFGHDVGALPQPGEDEDREHRADAERPHLPGAPQAALADHAGDEQRGVRGERRGGDRGAGQPPAQPAVGAEVAVEGLAGFGARGASQGNADREEGCDDRPVECVHPTPCRELPQAARLSRTVVHAPPGSTRRHASRQGYCATTRFPVVVVTL